MQLIDHTATDVTPDKVLQVASGFMAAKHLFAASELGLFEALADGPTSIDEAASATGLDAARLQVVADANVALGFIERSESGYINSPVAQAFLAGQSPADMRPLLSFWNRVSYPMWARMEETVRTGHGHAPDFSALDPESQRVFSVGVEAISRPTAEALAETYDFTQHRRVLDVGGGTGSFLLAIQQRCPNLGLTLFELPGGADVARGRLAGHDIGVVAGDMFRDALPPDHDAAIVANVVHVLSPKENVELLRRLRRSLEPGGRVLLVDFWLNAERTTPTVAALISGEFMTITGTGRSYAAAEATAWLEQTGYRFVEQTPLSGPQSLIVGEVV